MAKSEEEQPLRSSLLALRGIISHAKVPRVVIGSARVCRRAGPEHHRLCPGASDPPYEFRLGAGEVVAGFDEGVTGMRVGGKRQVVIPPALGYGPQANGPIPANSVLVFTIDLVSAR
jgi:FKBP-type peptidyl-prolyl cis-trans isomerase 2